MLRNAGVVDWPMFAWQMYDYSLYTSYKDVFRDDDAKIVTA